MDLYICYSSQGTAYSDFECEKVLLSLFEGEMHGPLMIHTSTENIILASRVLHQQRKLGKGLFFLFENYLLQADQNGRVDFWPKGFAEHSDGWLMKLIGWDSSPIND